MVKVRYTGVATLHTIHNNSTPSGNEYRFDKQFPTEVKDKDDIAWFRKRGGFVVEEGIREKVTPKKKTKSKK